MTQLLPQCLMCLKGFQIKQMMVDLFWFPPLIKTRKKMADVTKDVTLLGRSCSIRMKLTLKGRCLVLSQLYKLLIIKLILHVIYSFYYIFHFLKKRMTIFFIVQHILSYCNCNKRLKIDYIS